MKTEELLQLSSQAILKREENFMVIEQPLTGFRVPVRKPIILQLILDFIQPKSSKVFLEQQPDSIKSSLEKIIVLLSEKEVLVSVENKEQHEYESLQLWQFHDLLFHTQSRQGLNFNKIGATYRFGNSQSSESHTRKVPWKGETFNLPNGLNTESVSLTEALTKRETSYKTSSLSLKDLSEFLKSTLRIKNIRKDGSQHSFLSKLYPSGGSLHSIESYLAIYNCPELKKGLYYYDCVTHKLINIPKKQKLLNSILKNAQMSMGINESPAAVMIFTSRFERVFWKYESIGYRLILIELGTIFQTLYLVAANMGLSVCALGRGDSSEFSEQLNLYYFKETSIGEFVINGKL